MEIEEQVLYYYHYYFTFSFVFILAMDEESSKLVSDCWLIWLCNCLCYYGKPQGWKLSKARNYSADIQSVTSITTANYFSMFFNLVFSIFLINSGPCLRTNCSRKNQTKVKPILHNCKWQCSLERVPIQNAAWIVFINMCFGLSQLQIMEQLNDCSLSTGMWDFDIRITYHKADFLKNIHLCYCLFKETRVSARKWRTQYIPKPKNWT